MKALFICFILIVYVDNPMRAQGYINTEYITKSRMSDKDGNVKGKGDMMRFTGRYTQPLSVRKDSAGRVVAWTATVNGAYAQLNNTDEARTLNPDKILNAGLNISHTRPLGKSWRLITSLGAGVYAHPNTISFQSILANGAVIFAYHVNESLSVGLGLGLTNSYGVPMVMPMGYMVWTTGNQFRFSVDMSSGLKVKAYTFLSPKWRLDLTAIEMDGMSAVVKVDGKSKIYSSTMMKSMLSTSYCFSKQMSVYLGVGGSWRRSIRLSDRKIKSFFKNFSSDDNKYRFAPALWLTAGLQYKF